jgi:hypothetical protein
LVKVREARLSYLLPFDKDEAGFALPIFLDTSRPNLPVVQEVDEYRGVVARFKILDGDIASALEMESGPLSRVGSPQVYAFVTEDGTIHAGTLEQIEPDLRKYLSRHPEQIELAHQIAELVGTPEEKRYVRQEMQEVIRSTGGVQAASSFFHQDLLQTDVWRWLVSNAPSAEAARGIYRARRQIDPVTDSGELIDLSAIPALDYPPSKIAELEGDIREQFGVTGHKARAHRAAQSSPSETAAPSRPRARILRQYDLVEMVRSYNPNTNEDLLNRAYVYAMKAHASQASASGDPYFSRPLEVAAILAGLKLDDATIVSALLYDTEASRAEIDQMFGAEIGSLVESLTRLKRLQRVSPDAGQAERLRKLLLATADDVRVLLVTLANRLHIMRTLEFVPVESRTRIAEDTLGIYVPLADRMGLQQLRKELESRCLDALDPDACQAIAQRADDTSSRDSDTFARLRHAVDILSESASPEEFLAHTRLELFHDQVFCFTPKGKLIVLPRHANVIDFAYAVHTDVGDRAVGCKINGKIAPLSSELENGDEVEVVTSKAQPAPPSAWEALVVTSKARAAIRRATRAAVRDQYVGLGRRIVERLFERARIEYADDKLKDALPRLARASIEDVMAAVGRGEIKPSHVARAMYPDKEGGTTRTRRLR